MAVASGAYKKALEGDQTPKQVLVKIDRVTKKFDETIAVDDVSLEINKGEIFALLGGSGSGKSTLLRMLAGFERPTEGRIFLDGVDITDLPPYERPINMMFQSYALFPHMTVAQNIAFGLKQDKMSTAEIDARVGEMLKLVHMSQYAKRKPHQLSGGQRQRVALARSLAKRPKLLLLDEPMGALDKKLRSQMQLELVEIIERVGVTCVMVTHDQEEAMTMAQRIAIMHLGWIAQIGSPIDIYETPVSRLVCEFIGNVNLFDGEVVDDAEGYARINLGSGHFVLLETERDVLGHGHVREQGVGLEHHVDRPLVGRHVGDVHTIEVNTAFCWALETGEHTQQGGFARSRSAEHGEDFAFVDFQGHIVHGNRLVEFLRDPVDFDQHLFRCVVALEGFLIGAGGNSHLRNSQQI